jgi:hypothetical protein
MDQDKSDHHFRKDLARKRGRYPKVETAKSQTLFQGSLLNYFFVLFAVMVAAQEFTGVLRKELAEASFMMKGGMRGSCQT